MELPAPVGRGAFAVRRSPPPGALESAVVGDCSMTRDDLVLGDDDGVLFVPSRQAEKIFTPAETIRDTERRQAERIRTGVSLRSQVRFGDF
jgi:regulator of RNase E activity RraA